MEYNEYGWCWHCLNNKGILLNLMSLFNYPFSFGKIDGSAFGCIEARNGPILGICIHNGNINAD
jgi:hypothetical protein